MPELPEVETIRRGLEPHVTGKIVQSVEIGDPKIFQTDPERLRRSLPGRRFEELERRGKYLFFQVIPGDWSLVVHLGMTGQLTLRDPDREDSPKFLRQPDTGLQRVRQHPPDQHTHLQVHLESGQVLQLRDVRKFGKVYFLEPASEELESLRSRLGMEPMTEEYALSRFLEYLEGRKARIKSLLLDQRFVAGVGNIYADEALFEAGIHPARRVRYLRKYEKKRLFHTIPLVLEKGIQFGGTSLRDYIDSDGERGTHQDELQVYGREGKPCRRDCGSLVEKIYITGRGTHFCPRCQKRH